MDSQEVEEWKGMLKVILEMEDKMEVCNLALKMGDRGK